MGDINLKAALGGQIVLTPTNTASNYTATFPAITGVVAVQAAASYTAGSVLFANSSGQIAQDNANFFWDDTNNYLGVGTSSPSQKLHIYGNLLCDSASATNIYVQSSGVTYTQFQTTSSATTLKTIPANPLIFGTNDTEKMRLDSAGNLGVAVTPSAWASGFKGVDFNNTGSVSASVNVVGVYTNVYLNNSSTYIYKTNNYATMYLQNANGTGQHQWHIAPSGTAGNAITFTQAMTLDASGQLGVGTTSPSNLLHVSQASTDFQVRVTGTSAANAGSIRAYNDGGQAIGLGMAGSTNSGYGANVGFLGTITNVPQLFLTNNIERARFLTTGNVLCLSGGSTSANGTGIAFPATQSASTDVNTLDDYEEGTWTPVATPGSGSLTSYSSFGSYIKIGSQVWIFCRINIVTPGTAAGSLNFSGLPFANGIGNQVPTLCREQGVSSLIYQAFLNGSASTGIIFSTSGGAITWTTNYSYVFQLTYSV